MPLPDSTELVKRHGRFLRSFARALVHDEAAAGDLEQETWAAALELREPLQEPRAWLAATAKRIAWTRWRSDRRRAEREQHAAKDECVAAATLDAGDLLQRALHALEEPFKSAVVARYLEGVTPQQIAERSGAPIGTVKSRLKRGLAKLREGLDAEHGGRRAWCQVLVLGLGVPPGGVAGLGLGQGASESLASRSSAVSRVSGRSAAAPTALGGPWFASLGMKSAVAAVALLMLGVLVWSRNDVSGGSSDLARSEATSLGAALSAPVLDDLDPLVPREEIGETEAYEEAAPPPVIDEFKMSLAVEVLDQFGRAVPFAKVALAPLQHPFNYVGSTNRRGRLNVAWRSRQPSMEVLVAVRARGVDLVGVRRLTAQQGMVRGLRVRASTDHGSKYTGRFAGAESSTNRYAEQSQPLHCVDVEDGEIAFRLRAAEPILESYETDESRSSQSGDSSPLPGVISGTVLDGQGEPVPGYAVSWGTPTEWKRPWGRTSSVITDEEGRYRIESPPGLILCSAGPVGNSVDLSVELASGGTHLWNPVVSSSRDVLVQAYHPSGLDVDHIILETSYDDGETLWVGRAITDASGHGTIFNWPQSVVDVAFIAPEKVACVPVLLLEGVRTGERAEFRIPEDSEVTILPVKAALSVPVETGVRLHSVRVFSPDESAGTSLPLPLRDVGSCTLVLPGGEWRLQWTWSHGLVNPLDEVFVAGDQPIELGEIKPPPIARLVIPAPPSEGQRLEVSLALPAVDSRVFDSGDAFDSLPEDRTLSLPPGKYRAALTGEGGTVRESEFTLAAGEVLQLPLP